MGWCRCRYAGLDSSLAVAPEAGVPMEGCSMVLQGPNAGEDELMDLKDDWEDSNIFKVWRKARVEDKRTIKKKKKER